MNTSPDLTTSEQRLCRICEGQMPPVRWPYQAAVYCSQSCRTEGRRRYQNEWQRRYRRRRREAQL